MGVSQHGQVIEEPQRGSALAELGREQQQAFPDLLRRSVCFTFLREKPSDQLRAKTDGLDLDRRTRIYQLIVAAAVSVITISSSIYYSNKKNWTNFETRSGFDLWL